MRENGYIVFNNSDATPYRSYILATDGSVSWSEYVKKYRKSDVREIFVNPQGLESFVKAISNNSKKWNEEIARSFEENEKKVSNIISNIKNSLSATNVTASLQRILKAF